MGHYSIGDIVWWSDPDDGMCSGRGRITGFSEGIVYIVKEDGGEVEAPKDEIRFIYSTTASTGDEMDKCFACGKPLKGADLWTAYTIDGQRVDVGADCNRLIKASWISGYQPPKGGPRLYTRSVICGYRSGSK